MEFHLETLPGNTAQTLRMLTESGLLHSAYLAGGTAIALQLGHRISHDLDFFTTERFDEPTLGRAFEELGLTLDRTKWQTIIGRFGNVHFSYFLYKYPLLCEPLSFEEVSLANLHDLAAMKLEAIAARGAQRDFIDLFMILQSENMSLRDLIVLHLEKYQPNHDTITHALRSLTYFTDADDEQDRPLEMLIPLNWSEVKSFFLRETEAAAKELLEGGDKTKNVS